MTSSSKLTWTKFFSECLNDILCWCCWWNTNTFCCNFLALVLFCGSKIFSAQPNMGSPYPFRTKKWDFWTIFLVIKSNDAMELAGVTVRLWNGEQIQPLFVPFVNQITHRFRHLPFSLENNDSFKSIFMFSHKNRNNIMFLGTISLISIKITWTLKHLKSLYKDPTRCLYSPLWRV